MAKLRDTSVQQYCLLEAVLQSNVCTFGTYRRCFVHTADMGALTISSKDFDHQYSVVAEQHDHITIPYLLGLLAAVTSRMLTDA